MSESDADLPPTKKSNGATLATPPTPMSSKRSNERKMTHSPESESEADNHATKKSRGPVDTQVENNDDRVEKGEEEEDDDQELVGVTLIPDVMPLDNYTAAAKIQSLFRGYCDRTMKPKAQPRVEKEEEEAKATAAAAAATALMQMKAEYSLTTIPEEEATDEDAAATIIQALIRGVCKRVMNAKVQPRAEFDAAAIDATAIVNEENESESFEFEFDGGVADDTADDDDDDDDNNTDESTTKEDDASSISSATEEEENKGDVGGVAVEDQDELGGDDASELAAPPRRKRSRTRLMAALRCELDGHYWTSATSRRVIVRG